MFKYIFKAIWQSLPQKDKWLPFVRNNIPFPERIWRHLSFEGPIRIVENDLKFKLLHVGHRVENEIFWTGVFGSWEKESLRFWAKLCETSHVIFDIGANTGVYSMLAKAVNPTAKVVAVEPVPTIANILRGNACLNSFEVVVFEGAFSNKTGNSTLHKNKSDFLYSASIEQGFDLSLVESIEVKSMTVDDYVSNENISQVDLLKIDVEGHELKVLDGMLETVEMFRPVILVEILSESALRTYADTLNPLGYKFMFVDEERGLTHRRPEQDSSRNVVFATQSVFVEMELAQH